MKIKKVGLKPKLRNNDLRFKASAWLRKNRNKPFDIPMLTECLNMNPDSRRDTSRIYQDVIVYWRNKAIEYYKDLRKAGYLDSVDRFYAWNILTYNYNQHDAYVFLWDDNLRCYMQPGLEELEIMDKRRLQKQWHGILTVMDEMKEYDAKLLIGGVQKAVGELEEASRPVNILLGDGNAD